MKTVADFKRAVKVGTSIHTVYHCEAKRDATTNNVLRDEHGQVLYTDRDMGVAKISIVQTTQFAVSRIVASGERRDSWCSFPKATQCEIKDNKITIFEQCDRRGRIPVLTYTLVEPAPLMYQGFLVEEIEGKFGASNLAKGTTINPLYNSWEALKSVIDEMK